MSDDPPPLTPAEWAQWLANERAHVCAPSRDLVAQRRLQIRYRVTPLVDPPPSATMPEMPLISPPILPPKI